MVCGCIKLVLIYIKIPFHISTNCNTAGDPGGRDRTLAVKKIKIKILGNKNYLKKYCVPL